MCSYQCCHHKPQWPSSTWRSGPGPGWPGWGRRSLGRGWRRTNLCCPTLGASTWSGCVAPPGRCKWTGPRWLRSCERARRWPPPPERAGHRLEKGGGTFDLLAVSCCGAACSWWPVPRSPQYRVFVWCKQGCRMMSIWMHCMLKALFKVCRYVRLRCSYCQQISCTDPNQQ